MQNDQFEWSDAKARANLRKHEVSFEAASLVFDDRAASMWSMTAATAAKIASTRRAWSTAPHRKLR
jgi:uncharacterized DUF497 family protein